MEFYERHPLILSFLLILILLTITGPLTWIDPYFETNDDVWMMLWVSGLVTGGPPTEYLPTGLINICLIQVLASLYSAHSEIAWYGWMHLGSIFLALWSMLYALTVYNPSPLRWLLFLFCFLGFVLPFAISLQFTKTSFLVAQGALFLLCATLYGSFTRAASPGRTFARIMCVVFLLSLSISIRVESLYLVLALGTPALLHLVYKAWCARGARLFVVLIMGLGSLVVLIDSFGTRGYSQKPEWTNYLEITRLRRSIAEYGSATYYERSKQLFDDIGWSKNDYDMLMDSFWVDPEIYSLENFRKIRLGYPFNRTGCRLRRWITLVLARTIRGPWASSRPGSAPMRTVLDYLEWL